MAATRPHEAPARVIIIDDADRLNVNAANCLLKTLEEPAAGTHIVLVTSAPDRMLADDPLARAAHPLPRAPAEALVALLTGAHGDRRAPRRGRGRAGRRLGGARAARRAAPRTTRSGTRSPRCATRRPRGSAARRPGRRAHLRRRGRGRRRQGDQAGAAADPVAARAPVSRRAGHRGGRARAGAVPRAGRARWRRPARPRLVRALAAVVEADGALAANMNALVAVERLLLELRRQSAAGRGAMNGETRPARCRTRPTAAEPARRARPAATAHAPAGDAAAPAPCQHRGRQAASRRAHLRAATPAR